MLHPDISWTHRFPKCIQWVSQSYGRRWSRMNKPCSIFNAFGETFVSFEKIFVFEVFVDYFMEKFFWAPIPFKLYQNTSGSGTAWTHHKSLVCGCVNGNPIGIYLLKVNCVVNGNGVVLVSLLLTLNIFHTLF